MTLLATGHLRRFEQQAGLIDWRDTGLERCVLDADRARILHVAAMLEEDTAITTAHARTLGLMRCPDIAAFLPQWEHEEHEHALALRFLLRDQHYRVPQPTTETISIRRRLIARLPAQPLALFPETAFLFCVLGAAAEYVATVMYSELAKGSDPPVAALLRAIARQEARHFAFFEAEAKQRGAAMSALHGRVATRVLRAVWEPIGVPTLGIAAWSEVFSEWL
ncbi:MAG: hypothetical protein RL219_164, partial [Actinomycetota bacterium]